MSGEMITCPSGLSGEIRGLTGAEARLLSDKAAIKSGTFIDKILSACWLETSDPGPYVFAAKPNWSEVLIGDRVFVLLRIRARSFGAEFGFKVQCPNSACRQRFEHAVDLTALPVRDLSAADRAAFADGNKIEGQLPDGSAFTFRLYVGADESRMLKAGAPTSFIGPMMARIYEISGLDEQGKRQYFEQGELSLAYGALAAMDEHDCGVETRIAVDCPACSEAFELEIPFDKGFLAPPARKLTT